MSITWYEMRPCGDVNRSWGSIAISSDGSVMLAAGSGPSSPYPKRLYRSTDSGSSWTEVQPAGNADHTWYVAMDSDGSVMLAFEVDSDSGKGRVYLSTNTGNSWSEIQPDGNNTREWTTCAMDDDGSVIIMGYPGEYPLVGGQWGKLLLSTNTGSSWTEVQPAGDNLIGWTCACMDSDGSVILVGNEAEEGKTDGRLYLSTDTGANWDEVQPAGDVGRIWRSGGCAMDSDGSVILVGSAKMIPGNVGRLYLSTDTGANWDEIQPEGDVDTSWLVDMSSNGSTMIARSGAPYAIYTSINTGSSWTEEDDIPTGVPSVIAESSNGSVFMVGGSTRLYSSTYAPPAPYTKFIQFF